MTPPYILEADQQPRTRDTFPLDSNAAWRFREAYRITSQGSPPADSGYKDLFFDDTYRLTGLRSALQQGMESCYTLTSFVPLPTSAVLNAPSTLAEFQQYFTCDPTSQVAPATFGMSWSLQIDSRAPGITFFCIRSEYRYAGSVDFNELCLEAKSDNTVGAVARLRLRTTEELWTR